LSGVRHQPWAITDVAVFDGSGIHQGYSVVVGGGHIAAVGVATAIDLPDRCQVVPGSGRTLLPGFIDAHVHLGLCRPRRVLAGGVTTCRDLGWPERRIFALRDILGADPASGPCLLAAGPIITAPGGYPSRAGWGPRGTAREVGSDHEAAGAVRDLAARGAAVIKIAQEPRSGPCLDAGVVQAIVQAAHGAGLRVTSHLGSLEELDVALAAGVDELAHGLWSNEEISSSQLDRMIAAGMTVVPTLHIDPSAVRIENLRRFLDAGGRVIYGTDMGNSGPPQGIDVAELTLMVRAGMTPLAVLASGTSRAASYLGLQTRGRIAVGAVADLVVVDGDPSEDLAVLARPSMVMREGRVVR
jgi:imidazolonepropionase-like amidohydrolase